jgi:hypothetical protein
MAQVIVRSEPKNITIQIRVTPAYLEALDAWCQAQDYEITRSEAIRRITMPALSKVKPKAK